MDENGDTTVTAILRKRAPVWGWLRSNFSLPSVLTIIGLLSACGIWVASLKTRVVVLETKVIPFVAGQDRISSLETGLHDVKEDLNGLKQDWRDAQKEAGTPPVSRRQRKK